MVLLDTQYRVLIGTIVRLSVPLNDRENLLADRGLGFLYLLVAVFSARSPFGHVHPRLRYRCSMAVEHYVVILPDCSLDAVWVFIRLLCCVIRRGQEQWWKKRLAVFRDA